jgi:hypothetical protein
MRHAVSATPIGGAEPAATHHSRRPPLTTGTQTNGEPKSIIPFMRPSDNVNPADGRPILVQSEDPLMLRALARILGRAGYRVLTREYDLIGAVMSEGDGSRPCLIIIDMPDDWQPSTFQQSITVVDGNAAPRMLWISSAVDASKDDVRYLPKPFTGSQLLARVEALLKKEQ